MNSSDAIQPGDIIFFPSNGAPWDFLIQLVSPRFTHVGVIDNDTKWMHDANLFGIGRHKYKSYKGVTVRRIKGATKHQIDALIRQMQDKDIKQYDLFGAIWAAILRKFNLNPDHNDGDKLHHCSERVTFELRSIGFNPLPHVSEESVFPDDLFEWDQLETVYVFR